MRILLLTQWFDPEPNIKGLMFARELRKRGHEVLVLTGFPNYPGGKIYPGYKIRLWQREKMDDVDVLRVPLYPSHSRSGIGRILNYVSFAASSALAALFVRKPDVVYVYHPPGTAVLAALILRIFKNVPFVIDVQDLWPDTLSATGMIGNRSILSLVACWMRLTYRWAAHIVVLSPGFRSILRRRGVERHKISVIANWAFDREASRAEPGNADVLGDRFCILFAGTMGKAQRLDTILDAASKIRDDYPAIQFVLMGGGIEVERLEAEKQARSLDNVRFLHRQTPAQAALIAAKADALIVHLASNPLFSITIPSKTQAYLQAGRPILMGVRGDAARLVRRAGAGLCFEPENPEALVEAIKKLFHMAPDERAEMGLNGRNYYEAELALDIGVAKFISIFQSVAGADTGP
jgi:glycosyltransferase involved in cell wall biosynthesis